MKNTRAASRTLLCAAAFLISALMTGAARAQSPLPIGPDTPPAYGVAQRLEGQAKAAKAAGNAEIARRRAYQAVIKLQEVVKSRSFGKSRYAREALREQANMEEYYLHDKNAAIQSLQTLHNTFPDDEPVKPEIDRLADELNQWNKKFAPPPAPPIHNLGAALYAVLDFFVSILGRQSWSYALAILLISILVKLALTPFSNKQYASMKEMQKLQPDIQELQAKHKNDKELLGRKMMELYKDHGVNPAAGCIGVLPTLPVMYLLYYMISRYQYEFVNGNFLWIGSGLSRQFPSYLGLNLGQPDIPLLLLYAGSMYITQKMTITPTMDPQQAETQKMMAIMTPFMTTYFFLQYHLPAAFVLYYLIFNILSTMQQKYYMRRRAGDPPLPPTKPSSGNGNGSAPTSSVVRLTKDDTEQTSSRRTNGMAPTAKGLIEPRKTHPKKKRR